MQQIPDEAKAAIERGTTVVNVKSSKQAGQAHSASIPIRLRGQVIGVINVRFQYEQTNEKTIAMIEQAADRLATALETARLLEETRQRAQRDALVSDVTGRLRSTLDLETVLRTATQELQKVFDLKEAEVQLGYPAEGPAREAQRKNGKNRE
jgi:GAF domain-containing protein